MQIRSTWNEYKDVLPCMFCMMVCGWSEGALFSLFPYVQDYWHLTYMAASATYLAESGGFLLAALSVHIITRKLGRTRAVVLAAGMQLLVQVAISATPPYPAFVALYAIFGCGWAIVFTNLNSYSSTLSRSKEKIGFLHAGYGLGSLLVPLASTPWVKRRRFTLFYAFCAGLSAINLVVLLCTFRRADEIVTTSELVDVPTLERDSAAEGPDIESKDLSKSSVDIASAPVRATAVRVNMFAIPQVYLYGAMFCTMIGAEHVIFGLGLRFLIDAKGGNADSAYTLTAFLATHTLARLLLPRFNAFIGEKKALLLYQSLFFVMALLIWRIRNLIAASALIAALGIPIGPMVPTTFILLFGDKRFSPDMLLQVSAFAICWGNVFGGISPFITGALTTRFGIAMMPLLPAIIVAISMLFTLVLSHIDRCPRVIEQGPPVKRN